MLTSGSCTMLPLPVRSSTPHCLSPNGNTAQERPLVSPVPSSLSPSRTMVYQRPLVSPTPASLPSPVPSSASAGSDISQESSRLSPVHLHSNSPSPISQPTVIVTDTPVSSQGAPLKRRPGRPPGSTKKHGLGQGTEYRKRDGKNDEFSLRRFYELGGRDYNEYLEWLKKQQQQQQQQQRSLTPSYMGQNLPAFTKLTPSAGCPSSPAQQMALPGLSLPQRPLYLPRTPEGALPAGYRPVLIPQVAVTAAGIRALQPDLVSLQGLPYNLLHRANLNVAPRLGCSSAPLSPREAESVLDLSTATKKRKVDNPSTSDSFTVRKLMRTDTESPRSSIPSPLTICTDNNNNNKYNNSITTSTNNYNKNRPLSRVHQVAVQSDKCESRRDINGNHLSPPVGARVESTSDLVDITSWDTDQVVRFISSVPGCQEYAEEFREHRIDGATLPHLSEDHLLNLIKMKLGPAIRLRLAITKLHSECKD